MDFEWYHGVDPWEKIFFRGLFSFSIKTEISLIVEYVNFLY